MSEGNIVSELKVRVTGDTKDAIGSLGLLDGKIAASAKNYLTSLGNMDNSLAKFVSSHPAAIAGTAAMAGGLVILGAKAVEAGTSYAKQTTQLKNTADITQGAADKISKAFLQTAGTSTFSADQIIAAYEPVAGRLGEVEGHALSSSEAMKVMAASQSLAEATGADLASATGNVSRVMKDYHLTADQAGTASNDLYNLQKLTGLSTDSLTTAFDRLQPILAASGMTMDQASGYLLDMTDKFGSGKKAIGMMGTTLQALMAPSSKAQGVLTELGITTLDANGKFLGLSPVLEELKAKLGSATTAGSDMIMKTTEASYAQKLFKDSSQGSIEKLYKTVDAYQAAGSATEKSAIINEMFGKKSAGAGKDIQKFSDYLNNNTSYTMKNAAGQAIFGKNWASIKMLVDGGSAALSEATKRVTENNAVNKAAEDNAKTLEGQQKILAASFKDVMITVGLALIPALTSLMGTISKIITPIAHWITMHQELTGSLAKVIALVITLGVVIATAVAVIGALSLPWTALVVVLAAVIVYHQKIMDFFKRFWPELLIVFTGGIGIILVALIKWHDQIWGMVQAVWNGIAAFFVGIWNIISGTVSIVVARISQIITTAWQTIVGITSAIWTTVRDVISSVWSVISAVITTAVNVVRTIITVAWNNINALTATIWGNIRATLEGIWSTITAFLSAIWNGIANTARVIWTTISIAITTIVNGISNAITSTLSAVVGVVAGIWNSIYNTSTAMWNNMKNTVIGVVNSLRDGISSAFQNVASAVASSWNGIKSAVAAPINFVINTVYMGGIKKAWDAVSGMFGGPSAPSVSPIAFATGGVLPGFSPGNDSVHAILSPGEGVLTPHAVRNNGGASFVDYLNSGGRLMAFASGGTVPDPGATKGSKSGTIVSNGQTWQMTNSGGANYIRPSDVGTNIGGTNPNINGATGTQNPGGDVGMNIASNVGGAVGDAVHAAGTFIRGELAKAAGLAFAPIRGLIGSIPGPGQVPSLLKGLMNHGLDQVLNWIKGTDQSKGVDPSTIMSANVPGNVASWLAQGMAIAGVNPAQWGPGLSQIAMSESGGNPNAVNTTDSNAKAGTPSAGLMQFIRPTFDSYAMPGHTEWMNPIDQVVADAWAHGYINSRYGGIGGVPGIKAIASGGGYVGYSVGGYANGGVIRVGENGPETINLGDRGAYVNRNGSTGGGSTDFDYDKLASAMQNAGVNIGSINVGSEAQASDVIDEFNWHLRVSRLGVQ